MEDLTSECGVRRPDLFHFKLIHQAAQLRGHVGQLLSGLHRFVRTGRCALRGQGHVRYIPRNSLGPIGGFGDVARHLVGGGALFVHGRGNDAGKIVEPADDPADRPDGLDCALGALLYRADFLADIPGCLGGQLDQFLRFFGDHGEALHPGRKRRIRAFFV